MKVGNAVEKVYDEFLDPTNSNNFVKILQTDSEDQESPFNQHKRKVMQISIQDNLNNAIALYNKNSGAMGVSSFFSMPKLTDQDWEKILTNVNFVSFMQGLPVGTKTYNNYSIITSTNNKQFVGYEQLYFALDDNNDGIKDSYHTIFCNEITDEAINQNKVIGYIKNDFERFKYYISDTQETKYYYKRPEYACYKCIINYFNGTTSIDDLSTQKKNLFYTTLARQRYNLDKVTKIYMNYDTP